jgi:integrase
MLHLPERSGILSTAPFGREEGSMKKLPRGMFRRGRSFYVRLFEGGQDRWVSLGRDFEEACTAIDKLRRGEALPGKRTVGEVVARWLETYVSTARNPKGQRLASTRVRKYLTPSLGWKQAGKVRTYRLWLEKQGVSTQTVAHLLSDARCFFGWCEDSGLIDRSPVPRRLLPRIQERPPDRLTADQVDALLRLHEPSGFMVRLGLGTGLRWGEMCRAQASDVERGMLVVSQTKTGRVRRVPLDPALSLEISRRVGRLVGFPEGNPMSFTRTVRRLSGVGSFHVHQLRHTFACRWLERGGSLAALQQVLGHSTVVTTQRYGRLDEAAIRREAETVAVSVANEG